MSAAATMIIDSAADLARRISDFGDASPTYDSLVEGYARLALQPGSAVLIFAPNSAEFLFHWIAILANGYVPCAIAPSTKTPLVTALQKSLRIAAIAGPRLDPARYQAKRDARNRSASEPVFDDALLDGHARPPSNAKDAAAQRHARW